jgi:hypothetical protein
VGTVVTGTVATGTVVVGAIVVVVVMSTACCASDVAKVRYVLVRTS